MVDQELLQAFTGIVGNQIKSELDKFRTEIRTEIKTELEDFRTDIKKEVKNEINIAIEPIKADIAELKTDVAELKTDVAELKTDVKDLKVRMANVEDSVKDLYRITARQQENQTHFAHEMDTFKSELIGLREDVKVTRITIENHLTPRVSEIEGCYTSTFDYYKNQAANISKLMMDYRSLSSVVTQHSVQYQQLAAIVDGLSRKVAKIA